VDGEVPRLRCVKIWGTGKDNPWENYPLEMNFIELKDFIDTKMKMSHVYQPLLIRLLVEAGGQSTLRQLAKEFSAFDEAQIVFYEDRLKKMPIPVLKNHGVASRSKQLVTLEVNELTLEQRREIIVSCEQRIAKFLKQRGVGTWSSLLELDPVGETIRYQVLTRDKQCLACGVKAKDAVLQVDHIIPRSKGGSNKIENLQTLCAPCNRGKSNLDDTDLR
jgi:hypothetical protein